MGGRLLPIPIVALLALAAAIAAASAVDLLSAAAAGWLFAATTMLTFAVYGWRLAGTVARANTARREVNRVTARLAAIVESSADAIIGLTREANIETWNAGAQRLYGYAAADAIGKPIMLLAPPEDCADVAHVIAALSGETVTFESEHVTRDGRRIMTSVTLSPIHNAASRITGLSCIAHDITARKRGEQATARLAAIVDSSDDAILAETLEGRINTWNEAAERLYGYPAEEAIGQHISMLIPPEQEGEMVPLLAQVRTGQRVSHVETRRRRKDGRLIDVSLSLSPIRNRDGEVVGASAIARDIGERKNAERLRERALADLEEAQRIAKVGSWTWDPDADEVTWSAQMYEIFGRPPGDGPATGEAFFAYVHPEDRGLVSDGYAGASGDGARFELDYRIVSGAGEHRVLHALGYADPSVPGAYLGTVQDVTAQHAAEARRREAEERFRRAFEEAPIGMALISPDGLVEHANSALGTICGRIRHELEGSALRELLHPADADGIHASFSALAGGEIEQLAAELRIVPVIGAPVDILIHGTALRYGADQPDRLLCQFQDITDRKRYEAQLRYMADHDPLTGLVNRRKFEAELNRHVAHVKRYGPAGALLMLDLDHFKSINDTLGHGAGDELIVSIATVLRQRLRAGDILARIGGDEFAVLLPVADQGEATQVANALIDAIRTNTTLLEGERKQVTSSVGIAMFDGPPESLSGESVLIEGDLAMYDAKEAGRDSCAVFTGAEHLGSRTKARLTWVTRIEHALESDRLVLVAQPIFNLHAGRVGQHELLLRMLDEQDELIPPGAFLHVAERFGLIARVDEWVVTQAIELLEQCPELHLHVNISGKSLGDPRLLQAIDDRLRDCRVDPSRLVFEVTETAAVANITHAQTFAQRLRDHGCRFALDDFGAGFGSFYYLKHLPFDFVKIDGEFVQHATTGQIDQLVIQAVVQIAQGLGKETIAEFVTDERTQRMVSRLGVDYAQGYHIGTPAPTRTLVDNCPPTPSQTEAAA